jgi:outer membrane protein assembly factor BamB
MRYRLAANYLMALTLTIALSSALAVTSKVVRQDNATDFQKGQTKDVIIGSEGTLQLGPESQVLASDLADAWTVNAIIADASGAIYIGTSPNGAIYKYANGTLKKLYPADVNAAAAPAPKKTDPNTPASKEPNDANAIKAQPQKYLTNEHIFALGLDSIGRVLAGVSGKHSKLLRIDASRCETVFEPNDADYIFAITTDEVGNIYLGTGPHGNVYRLNASAQKPELIYHAADKNILSLVAGFDSFLYAGSDERGLIYRIDPVVKTASVLYDAQQSEITSLLFDAKGNLYAAATSEIGRAHV